MFKTNGCLARIIQTFLARIIQTFLLQMLSPTLTQRGFTTTYSTTTIALSGFLQWNEIRYQILFHTKKTINNMKEIWIFFCIFKFLQAGEQLLRNSDSQAWSQTLPTHRCGNLQKYKDKKTKTKIQKEKDKDKQFR